MATVAPISEGQTAPDSPWPEAMIATASPRRRSNQRVALAIRGAIMADLPSRPISRPFATHSPHMVSDQLTMKAPVAIITDPNITG